MLNLLFPKVCAACSKRLGIKEQVVCTRCRHELAIASHHLRNDSEMKLIFYGRVPIVEATALLRFQKKGLSQQLLHNLKYRGQQKIGAFLGKWLGEELNENTRYKNIDCVIPVPLHKKKQRIRGYNQVTKFSQEIAKSLAISCYDNVLFNISKTKSQVFKNRVSRFSDKGHFVIKNSEQIKNKHVLLVDDIVTTGATLERCAIALLEGGASHISLATMAIA